MTEHNNPQDNLTVPRELLRQAIEALDRPRYQQNWYQRSVDDAKVSAALRTALEQPAVEHAAEIVSVVTHPNAKGIRFTHHGLSLPIGTKLFAAPKAQPAPVQEPTAFASPGQLAALSDPESTTDDAFGRYIPLRKTAAGNFVQPLYTTPQAQPRKAVKLSDEELRDALRSCPTDAIEPLRTRWLYAKDFARAIEQAVLKKNGVTE